jgi:hypothetical protein
MSVRKWLWFAKILSVHEINRLSVRPVGKGLLHRELELKSQACAVIEEQGTGKFLVSSSGVPDVAICN